MKKTLTINLGGSVFHIEDDAYLKLDHYLETLKTKFNNDPEGEEIIADIEARMAEIFHEEMEKDGKAVTINMVELAIGKLGNPNDIANEDVEEEAPKNNKKLYRDGNRKVFGGVCSGLANYLKIDAVLMRIIFVVLLLATSGGIFFVYLVLWLAIPEAKSTSQRMEMRGEKVNISSIEKKVKSQKQYTNQHPHTNSNGRSVGETILKIIAWIIGGFFIMILLMIVLSLLATLFGLTVASTVLGGLLPEVVVPGHFFLNVPHDMVSHTAGSAIGMILFIGAPILLIIFILSKVFFKHNGKVGWVIFLSLALWLVGIVLLAFSSLKIINRAADMDISIVGDDNRGAIVVDGDTVLSFRDDSNDQFKMKLKSRKNGSLEFNEGENMIYISKLFTADDTLIISVSDIKDTKFSDKEYTWVKPKYQLVNTNEQNFKMALALHNYELKYDNFKMTNPIFTWSPNQKKLNLREFIAIENDKVNHDKPETIVLEIPQGMFLKFENDADELFQNLSTEEKNEIESGKTYKMSMNEINSTP